MIPKHLVITYVQRGGGKKKIKISISPRPLPRPIL